MNDLSANYRVKDLLRESADAVFYRALDGAERPVVLEVLRAAAPDARDLERLENEYRLGSSLATSAIVHPIAVGRFEGRAAIAREDVPGTTLDRLCGDAMPIGRFLPLALGAAHALRELHAAGLIHRDIKPANLYIDENRGHVRVARLGLASLQPREQGPITNPALIEGTLPYMSPEQTGRMNHAVDQRSDLYSLGVTFYEMLTGSLPFAPNDPLEWVHCHIARIPAAPDVVTPGVPQVLARIVMKLLAKASEDRYQTAAGLVRDLERCQQEWIAYRRIDLFELALHDVSDRWLLPQRLFGRQGEVQVLLDQLAKVANRQGPILALVSGPAGVGKSALVSVLHPPIVQNRGVFAAGKFDPFAREIPYATFVQALRGFVLDVLTETGAGLARWRERLQQALGPHGQLMVDLIPQLELVVGPQPAVAELGAVQAQARFASTFRKLLRAIAAPGRPLVLFLDDLQWVDPGSLRLLEELMADAEARDLMIMGAYRDDEVGASHPLFATLATIRGAGARLCEMQLGGLGAQHIAAMTCGVLRREDGQVQALATLVHDKTGGNPFFAGQFLTSLYREELITFDPQALAWTWDIASIAAQDLTSNVAAFMVARLERLSGPARRVLGVSALLGSSWDVALLAAVLADERDAIAETISEIMASATAEGLLVRRDGSYRFSHDRVRQAAYDIIAEPERTAVHFRVGQVLLERATGSPQGEALFELAYHLNLGTPLVTDFSLRRRAAEINLQAGRQAKRSTAYAAAIRFFAAGAAQMAELPRDPLAFDLDLEKAECHVLAGHHDEALTLLTGLLDRAVTVPQKAAVYRARQGTFQLTGQIARAVEDELAGLRVCGIELPPQPTVEDVAAERIRVQAVLAQHPPESILNLPTLTDATLLAATQIVTPSFWTDHRLYFVHVAKMVQLSIEEGIGPSACYWFSNYALALAAFGEYRDAARLAAASYQLALRHPGSPKISDSAFLLAEISFWTKPYDEAIALMRTAYRAGLDNGTPESPLMSTCLRLVLRLSRGDSLPELQDKAEEYLTLLTRAGARDLRDLVAAQRQFIRQLRGQTRALGSFDADDYDVAAFEAALTTDRIPTALCYYWNLRLRAAYLADNIPDALSSAARAQELMWSGMGQPAHWEFVLYHALCLAAALDSAPADKVPAWQMELRGHEEQMRTWANLNPQSFAHGHLLVAAELARVEGRSADALALYDRSIVGAHAGGFALDEALAYELLGRLHRTLGALALAELCRREARACYASRGATAKVRQLDGGLAASAEPLPPAWATLAAPASALDVIGIVGASQAISGELTVERVTVRLMELVLAEGGAERGLLVVPRGDELGLAAEATITPKGTDVLLVEPACAVADAPLSLLQYVWRTAEGVVLDDAAAETRYASDEYVVRARPRSALCTPIRRQGQVIGLLYLENRAVTGAFTRPRLQVLELLAAQAAISLENAALLAQERAARDVAKESARRAALLAEASALLGQSLDPQVIVASLGRLLVEKLVDWCLIEFLDLTLVFQEGKRPEDKSDIVMFPLFAHGRALGSITLGRIRQDDRELLEEIARRAAMALENGELFRKSEEAVRLREEFLSVASHELNTPLAGLTLNVQVLREQVGRDGADPFKVPTAHLAELIERQTQRLSRLVDALLDVTRLQQQELRLSLETIDLGALVQEVLERFQPQMVRARCLLIMTIENGVGVCGDRGRLEQLLLNLLSNAIKFGAGKPVEVGVRKAGGMAHLHVRDHGIGIDLTRQAQIFARFERGVSASHYGGLGLGLYICRQIVDAHRGLVRVDRPVGEGAMFTVELPVTRPPD